MGVNTEAILFYGFHADEGAWDEFIGEAWEEKLASSFGHPKPEAPFSDASKAEHVEYWKVKAEDVEKSGCEIDFHCSGSAPMPYACVKASKTVADRGETMEINNLIINPTWDEELQAFALRVGIPYEQPKWWLVSYWSS